MSRAAPIFNRRAIVSGIVFAGLAPLAVPARSAGTTLAQAPRGNWTGLVERAEAALERFAGQIKERDRLAIVDFALASSAPRMLLVDRLAGRTQRLRVSHGRGSDPDHSGWLQTFSNVPASNASSRGAYVTGAGYIGSHGASRRLIGLEASNDKAESRAIVIHGAWYCNDDIIARTGKLGRSEGCFAVSEDAIGPLLEWLGPGRLLYADKAA